MRATLAPKYVVIDNFLPEDLVASLDQHVRTDRSTLELVDVDGGPQRGDYSAARKLWVRTDALGPFEPAFRANVMRRFPELCDGTGVASFPVAAVETKVCAQRDGSFLAKHVDTDTGEARDDRTTDRLISGVYYFPREPLGFAGGELVFYDFTGQIVTGRVTPRRNRFVAFPSFAYHEVTPVTATLEGLDHARWSVSCWLHRAQTAAAEH